MKWRFRFGAVMGNALEYYDVAVFAAISMYLSAELERQGYQQATEMVWGIFALRFITRPIGGYVIGRYADKFGKKSALILTSVITGISTLCMAFLPISLLGAYTPFVILILQMILSFSYAGEYPALATYLLHDAKKNEYARISALMTGSGLIGVIVSLAMVLLLDNLLDPYTMQTIGWRIPLLLGVVNIMASFWFRSRLPNLPMNYCERRHINWYLTVHIFLIAVPGAITFYAMNLSSSLIREYLNIGGLKSLYSLVLSSLLLVFIAVCAWLTDKYSSAEKIYRIGVIGTILFSVPLYFMMTSQMIGWVFFALLSMMVFATMILCNWAYMMAVNASGQATELGIGYNVSSTIIGGATPLVVSYLVGIHLAYVGGFVALCCLTLLISTCLPKPQAV
ncbi:MFS transporter [Providencia rettgeri]|nr:MFS transporter [Providencia rettgeri]